MYHTNGGVFRVRSLKNMRINMDFESGSRVRSTDTKCTRTVILAVSSSP